LLKIGGNRDMKDLKCLEYSRVPVHLISEFVISRSTVRVRFPAFISKGYGVISIAFFLSDDASAGAIPALS
jgi:hypothetical protein